ncbi:hypothetical protein POM88_035626 [Heracleum sosnowskyi]|uniref:TF-B3 domain-containing protein n=1 Tax=Heracleum sosnowskyi TaxID=360622 RepID=A0AAD8HLT9_9APIA|nr:hypothetical protein POM88_035620 [Heracleum sosnowskyi]KAK1369534.1 hypothetical protein POM88_035626 [Heracleum sosnowskyi]
MGRRPPPRKPSFLQILVKDFSKKLLVPSKFVRLHRGTLARKCILRPSGTQDSWPVKTKQINNLLYFKKGWEKFAQHHSLGFGDLLVFRYAQDCEFYVDMFDKSCCCQEKESNPKTAALEAAEDFMASSEFPTFNKIMQSTYVGVHGYMPLKPDFAKMHLKDGRREVKIEVSGKTWTVRVRKVRSSYRFSTGWTHLATELALKVDDACVFELVDAEDYTLKLSIFSSTS